MYISPTWGWVVCHTLRLLIAGKNNYRHGGNKEKLSHILVFLNRKGNDFIYVIYPTKTNYYEISSITASIAARINCPDKK